MFKHKRIYIFIKACIASYILFMGMNVYAQSEREKLENRREKLEKELAETSKELNETKKDKSSNLKQLMLINKQIDKREELIKEIENEVGGIDGQVYSLSKNIVVISNDLENLKKEYAAVINSIYHQKNETSKLMFVFSAKSFNQAFKRIKYLQQYTDFRREQVNAINRTRLLLAAKKIELERKKGAKLTLKQKKEVERLMLSNQKKSKDEKIKSLTVQEKSLLKKMSDNQVALNKLKNAIEELVAAEIRKANEERARKAAEEEAARKARENIPMGPKERENRLIAARKEAEKKAAKPAENKTENIAETKATNNRMSVTAEDVELSGNFSNNRGRLPSPIAGGNIISSFGEHAHAEYQNIKIKNNGVDIATPQGGKAKCIFEGVVSTVMNITNLNYVIMVRHGDYLSVYSNIQTVYVKKGDKLKTGQPIGLVATTVGETRPKLHFELWQGTTVLNPSSWIRF